MKEISFVVVAFLFWFFVVSALARDFFAALTMIALMFLNTAYFEWLEEYYEG